MSGRDEARRALLARALAQLERQRAAAAVIGVGCRFPGAEGAEGYWRLLTDGVDATCETPIDRWDVDSWCSEDPDAPGKIRTRRGGFLDDVYGFDNALFGISPREASFLDPQQRLVLECSWSALEHAGIDPLSLRGKKVGVFLGVGAMDYSISVTQSLPRDQIDAASGTGVGHSAIPGRVSYFLGLSGPSIAYNTACSSSLVALHAALNSLRRGECELALVGGVNAILSPLMSVTFSKARMLSPDGRCKSFDASADGYARGEGCGIALLELADTAYASGRRVLAELAGAALNSDGASGGLTVPSGPSQQDVIQAALADARVDAADVSRVEAHGTGTQLGDPIELNALAAAYGPERAAPLVVSSVKTNIGHLEAAAGMAGFLKLALELEREAIAPHLHLEEPSPHLDWSALPLRVPTALEPWARGDAPRIAGLSSFGFTGTNGHVILREARAPAASERASGVHVLPLSTHQAGDIEELRVAWLLWLAEAGEAELADAVHTAQVGRAQLELRLVAVGANQDELARSLAAAELAQRPPGGAGRHAAPAGALDASAARALADAFSSGASVDWSALHAGAPRPPRDLPGLPFTRLAHRVHAQNSVALTANQGGRAHPLLGARFPSDEQPWRWRAVLEESAPDWLAEQECEHVPTWVWVECALAAAAEMYDDGPVEACELELAPAPLDEGALTVELKVVSTNEAGARFELTTRGVDSPVSTLRARGVLRALADEAPPLPEAEQSDSAMAWDRAQECEGMRLHPLHLLCNAREPSAVERVRSWAPLGATARLACEGEQLHFGDPDGRSRALLEGCRWLPEEHELEPGVGEGGLLYVEQWSRLQAVRCVDSVDESALHMASGSAGLDELRELIAARARSGGPAFDVGLPAPEAPGEQEAARGLLRSARIEHPELSLRCISSVGRAQHAALLQAQPHEQELRVGEQGLEAARLRRARGDALASAARFDATGSWAVTGGAGALGRRLCEWLAERGATRIVCAGRSAASRNSMAAVEHLRLDLTAEEAVNSLVERAASSGDLRGVFHLAGVLDDGLLVELDEARMRTVIEPKLGVAQRLEQELSSHDDALLVMFSSSAATLGSPGQASYSAASAGLAGIARRRRASAAHGLCIEWGPWAEQGMAASSPAAARRFGELGMQLLDPDLALSALDELLLRDEPVVAVMDVDWQRVAASLGAQRPARLGELLPPSPASSEAPSGALASELAALEPEARRARLEGFLRDALARILRMEPAAIDAERPLVELGLDSLGALELRNRLQAALGAAPLLTTMIAAEHLAGLAAALDAAQEAALSAELEALGPEELAALLEEEGLG